MKNNPIHIGRRGLLFLFDHRNSPFQYPTYTYVITTPDLCYLCDTHIGPESMQLIADYLKQNNYPKRKIILNSHYHWDHVWGNSFFSKTPIIAHQSCLDKLHSDPLWHAMINDSDSVYTSPPTRVLPNITFEHNLYHIQYQVLFFFSPGHSSDSSSCHDLTDDALFVGDNVEIPIPNIDWHNLNQYILTLQNYKRMNPKYLITSHQGLLPNSAIDQTLTYLEFLRATITNNAQDNIDDPIHHQNKKTYFISKNLERLMAEKSPKLDSYLAFVNNNKSMPLEQFRNELDQF